MLGSLVARLLWEQDITQVRILSPRFNPPKGNNLATLKFVDGSFTAVEETLEEVTSTVNEHFGKFVSFTELIGSGREVIVNTNLLTRITE